MSVRIKDLATTATSPAADDYIAIDGATNGTRKIPAGDIGGGGTSDDITNESAVSGETVTGALNSLSDQIAHKQDALTFDNSPTSGSNNPVKSSGIYSALQGKAGTSVATTSANGLMSSTDKGRLDTLYADYSSAITALGV